MRLDPPAGEALRAALGAPTVVRRLSSSPRSRVWLVEFDGSPAIVKQITGGADADDRYRRETTALQLGRRARPYVVPEVLGTDPGARVMVLEYLTEPRRAPGPGWMTDYAVALAWLHATTGAGDAGALPAWDGPGQDDARAFTRLAARLGVPVPARATAELDSLVERLNAPGHYALLHGDPCPRNAVRTAGGMVFVTATARQRLRHRLGVVATLGAGQRELAGLASLASAMRERIMVLWPGVRELPVAAGDPVDVYQRADGGPLA